MTFKEFLQSDKGRLSKACYESIEWLGDRTSEQALTDCQHGDWLMWWADKVGVDRRKLVLCAGHCANTVRDKMAVGRSVKAVDAAIAYGEGRITVGELIAAHAAAEAACAAFAAHAAAYAAHAAALAACAAFAASDDSAAAYAAAYAASAADDKELAKRQTVEIVRELLGQEILERTKMYLNEG